MRILFSTLIACLLSCAYPGAGRAETIYYGFFLSGQLEVAFATQGFVQQNTFLEPITLLATPPTVPLYPNGYLNANVYAPSYQPTFGYGAYLGGAFDATITSFPYGNPSNQFPTTTGVFPVDGLVYGSFGGNVGLDTLVIQDNAFTPEPSSLALSAIIGISLLITYLYRRAAGIGWPDFC
jgi:hypothetical protein